ncbi:MAG: hypothetical protein CSA58_10135 [Micrococcales bacterium]|nr:MAG: hypothetical protein CSA58_10135 [Micrococcales bacterium]
MTVLQNETVGGLRNFSPFHLTYLRVGPWGPIRRAPSIRLRAHDVIVSCPQLTFRLAYTPMPGLIPVLPEGIWGSEPRSLAEVPSHRDAGPYVRRYAFVEAPVHGALHQVLDGERALPGYCDIHRHDDAGELNVLLPGDPFRQLEFDLYNDGPVSVVAPATMWIEPGADHAAMATGGTGFFFALRVPLTE